ncbi:MAG: TonB-dependent receptor plug domain-containing protein [Spirochaetia bacterium]|nr:TonB-dependent receptor plug domain-containing protein [Spirochaetia bacterium]
MKGVLFLLVIFVSSLYMLYAADVAPVVEKEKIENTANKDSDKETDDVRLEPVQIRAKKTGKGAEGTYQNILFHEGENKTSQTISQVLENQSGVKVNRYGARGTYSVLSIRGAASNQTGIYIDGIGLNGPLGESVNLENLPMDMFQSGELYRSYTPVHLPGSHIGGAFDLIPAWPSEGERNYFINSHASSLQGASLGFGFAMPMTMHYFKIDASKNKYQYLDDNGTRLYNFSDDSFKERENEDFNSYGYTGIFSFKKPSLKVFLDLFGKERGLPGVIGAPLYKVRLDEKRVLAKISYNLALYNFSIIELFSSYTRDSNKISDPENELSFGIRKEERKGSRFEIGAMPKIFLYKNNIILHLAQTGSFSNIKIDNVNLAERQELNTSASLTFQEPQIGQILLQEKALFLKDNPKEAFNSLFLANQNLDEKKASYYNSAVRFELFILELLNINNEAEQKYIFNIYTMFSSGQRHPSFVERYGNGQLVMANPDILPERANTLACGFTASYKKNVTIFDLNSGIFMTRSLDSIIFIQNSKRTMKSVNIGAADFKGLETELKIQYYPFFLSSLKYSFLEAVDDSQFPFYKGKSLPFLPGNSGNFYAEAGIKRFKILGSINYTGSVYRDRYNVEKNFVKARYQLDTGFLVYLRNNENIKFTFLVKNCLNELSSDVLGFPVPGRNYEVQFFMKI